MTSCNLQITKRRKERTACKHAKKREKHKFKCLEIIMKNKQNEIKYDGKLPCGAAHGKVRALCNH